MRFFRRPASARILAHLLAMPFIYGICLPIILLDLCLELYHRVCFPLYKIPYVRRSDYIQIFGRAGLSYLPADVKFNCFYCSYVNGFLQYAVRIAADTEAYFCGIRHREQAGFRAPPHHRDFLPYGDEAAFKAFINQPE